MKSLYRERYFTHTEKAEDFYKEVEAAIRPILRKYFEDGYSPRELGHIAHDCVHLEEACILMEHGAKESKKERMKNE